MARPSLSREWELAFEEVVLVSQAGPVLALSSQALVLLQPVQLSLALEP